MLYYYIIISVEAFCYFNNIIWLSEFQNSISTSLNLILLKGAHWILHIPLCNILITTFLQHFVQCVCVSCAQLSV